MKRWPEARARSPSPPDGWREDARALRSVEAPRARRLQSCSAPAPLLSPAALLTLAGTGRAAAFEEPDGRVLVSFGRELSADAPAIEGEPAPLLGAFAFDPAERPDALWRGLSPGGWLLPTMQYEREGAAGRVRVFGAPGEGLQARLDAARRQLDAAVVAELPPTPRALGRLSLHRSGDYPAAVEAAVAAIREGDLQKVVLARRSLALFDGPLPLARTFAQLAAHHPACVRYAWADEGRAWVGATPETLVRVDGVRVRCDALAATRDGSFASLPTEKERREHGLVVDAILAALAPFCAPISAPSAPVARRLRGLAHLHTPIEARLLGPTSLASLVAALHPTPAVGGAPRVEALALLRALEVEPRGLYAGPFLRREADGGGIAVVALRGAVLDGRAAWLTTGAGIVEGSDGWEELAETEAKMESVAAALRGDP